VTTPAKKTARVIHKPKKVQKAKPVKKGKKAKKAQRAKKALKRVVRSRTRPKARPHRRLALRRRTLQKARR